MFLNILHNLSLTAHRIKPMFLNILHNFSRLHLHPPFLLLASLPPTAMSGPLGHQTVIPDEILHSAQVELFPRCFTHTSKPFPTPYHMRMRSDWCSYVSLCPNVCAGQGSPEKNRTNRIWYTTDTAIQVQKLSSSRIHFSFWEVNLLLYSCLQLTLLNSKSTNLNVNLISGGKSTTGCTEDLTTYLGTMVQLNWHMKLTIMTLLSTSRAKTLTLSSLWPHLSVPPMACHDGLPMSD
jgi:hypothetical protein